MELDLLYWEANEGHLQFANQPQQIDSVDNFTTAPLIDPHFKWNCGFKGVFGYLSPETRWDCLARFTHMLNKATGQRETGTILDAIDASSTAFFPVLSMQPNLSSGDYVFSASMNWRVLLNLFDLYSGYHFHPSQWLELTPHFGLRGAQINQKLNANYSGGIFATGTDSISMKNQYWGLGPLLSIDPEIRIYKGLTLPLSVAGSALLGQFTLAQNEQYFSSALWEYRNSSFKLRWILDVSAALKYRFSFYQERYIAAFSIGWEYHLLFSQNLLPENQFHLLEGSKDLVFTGAFFSGQLSF